MRKRSVFLALLLLAGAAKAQEVACKAVIAGTRALVDATVHGLFDKELLRIVKLGMPGKLTVDATIVRKRSFWFGAVVTATSREVQLTWSEERGVFELDGHALPDPEHAALERLVVPVNGTGEYQVEISAKLVVVTQSSLGRVAGFLEGESDSTLARTVLGAIANDLTRSASGSCSAAPRR